METGPLSSITSALFPQPRKSEKFSIDSTALDILKRYSHSRIFSSGEASATTNTVTRTASENCIPYRYEYNGIVVYDSTARMPSETSISPFELIPRDASSYDRKDLELAGEFGRVYLDRQQYATLPKYPPWKPRVIDYTLNIPDQCLKFDSHFESGNLWKAIRVSETDYHLFQAYDVHTTGHTQWYYFSIVPYRPGLTVSISIDNLMKYDSLYLNGMQPLVYSLIKESREGVKWHRAGWHIAYYQNQIQRPGKVPGYYYTLSFQYTFEYANDTVYFAHCYPYTHTDLLKDLSRYQDEVRELDILRVNTLCATLAGNECPVLTITNAVSQYPAWETEYAKMMKSAAGRRLLRQRESKQEFPEHRKKRAVVLTARVHPGESNSSYMLKGAIEFLLGHSREARILRREYVFKIVPMLNPDGVKYGNYRCSLLGVDLNRRWVAPNKVLHPTIYYTKRLIQMVSEEHELVMYCDLHGHSMKKNVFVYGCTDKLDRKRNALLKLVPLLLHQRNKIFSFEDSRFRLEKAKEATARIVVFREMNVLNSYTLEASFCGPAHHASLENRDPEEGESSSGAQMNEAHLASLGRDLCKTLLVFLNPQVFRRKLNELTTLLASKINPPTFLTREKTALAAVSIEEKTTQNDVKSLEDLEKPSVEFTIENAVQEIGEQETFIEELSQVQTVDDSESGSDASRSDNEETAPKESLPELTPRSVSSQPKANSVSPVKSPQKPKSIPSARPKPKALNRSVDDVVSRDSSMHIDTNSTPDDLRTLGLNQQVERIYKMLKYYREAGGRLKAEYANGRSRPFSPVKLNQSAFPDMGFFDQWRRRKRDGERPRKRQNSPPDALVISNKSVSPERPRRREQRMVKVKTGREEPEELSVSKVFECGRFSIPASVRDAQLPLISKSFNFHR